MKRFLSKIIGLGVLAVMLVAGSAMVAQAALLPINDRAIMFSAGASVSGTSVTISVSNGTLSMEGHTDPECFEKTPPDPAPYPTHNGWYSPIATQTSPSNTAQITSGVLSGQTIPLSVGAGDVGSNCWDDIGSPATFSGSRTFTGVAAGNHTVNVRVTDNEGKVADRSVSFTIAASAPTCSASPASVTTGQSVTFTGANGSGYTWSATGGSPNSGSGNTFTTSYSTTGTKTVQVTSGGQNGTCTVQVTTPTAPVCAPSSQNATVGSPVTLTASGGSSGNYTWTTTGSSSVTPSGTNNSSLSVTYASGGAKEITVTRNGVTSTACVVNVGGGGTPPVLTLTASPNPVSLNNSPTISWTVSGATSCAAPSSGPLARWYWTGSKNPNGDSEVALPHTTLQSRDYSLTCSNTSGGETTRTVTVDTVDTPVSPIGVTLSANPSSGASPLNTTLTWTTSGSPDSCGALANPANAQWTGSKSVAGGNQQITGLTQTTTFTITCEKSGTSPVSALAQVIVNGVEGNPPQVTLTPNPASGVSPLNTTINYQTGILPGGGGSCQGWAQPANAQWTGNSYSGNPAPFSKYGGNKAVSNLTQTTTFHLECFNEYGSASDSKTVTVTEQTGTIIVTSNMSTTWTVSGQQVYTQTTPSTGAQYTNVPVGGYTIAPGSISGHTFVVQTSTSQNVSNGVTTTFHIDYTAIPSTEPSVTISANPTQVKTNNASILTWSSANVTNCQASGGWSGAKANSGSQSTGPLTADTTFIITCDDASGAKGVPQQVSDSVTVTVGDGEVPPPGGGDPQCSDGIDNDGDGLIDYPADPGCDDPLDNSEADTPPGGPGDDDPITECNDGFDNDGDGLIDDEDPGCFPGSASERGVPDIREI